MRYYFYSEGFAKRVKTKRVIEMNVGLRELAKKIKVSSATLSRLENGKTPEMETFLKVCHWLGVLPREFIQTKPFMDFENIQINNNGNDYPRTRKAIKANH